MKNMTALSDDTDSSTLLATYQGTINDVTLTGRTIYRNGEWNTLCLPFNIVSLTGTPLEGAIIRPLTDATLTNTTLTLTFGTAVNAIIAGMPYILKWESTADDLTNPIFENVTINSAAPLTASFETGDSQAQFIGTYAPMTLAKDDQSNRYLGSGNKLYYPTTDDFKVNAFRAYFRLGASAASAPMLVINTDDPTDVDGIFRNVTENNAYYTLDGRRMTAKPTSKGVYIYIRCNSL